MAVTTENSTQMTRIEGTPPKVVPTHDWHGRMRAARFDFTQGAAAGDVASFQRLVKLPAGKVRVHLAHSRIAHSAFGAARTLDLGWEAYTGDDGVAVVADPNGLDDGVDVSSAGNYNPVGTVGGDETFLFESQEGVVIAAQTNDDTIPAAATLKGVLYYSID
jgi:hypothetical protein